MSESKVVINPRAMTIEQFAQVLTATGIREVTPEMISRDLSDGAPQNADGTIDVIAFAAWLVREVCSGRRVKQTPTD